MRVPHVFARYADGSALLADCPATAGPAGQRARQAAAVGLEQAVPKAFAEPRPLMAGATAAGEVLTALPVLYHTQRGGRLAADLARPLGEHTWPGAVTAGVEREQQES